MNVLILTPDRVGSTLLQRLITVYMAAHTFDQPVINLHELTNGLIKYYSPVFNREVLGKSNDGRAWGYYQSLSEIIDLLNTTDHYKTSRLAHYHIQNRQDTMAQQVPFYQYLNDNFFIISARREDLLQHALSWCISTHSKKLNVYSLQEKINAFADIYTNKITVDKIILVRYLDQYAEYLKWVSNHFSVTSVFDYEQDLPRIEQYILGLPIFNNQSQRRWQDLFEIEFDDWNRFHYLVNDISGISQQLSGHQSRPALEFATQDWENTVKLQSIDKTSTQILASLSQVDQEFLVKYAPQYLKAKKAIDELVQNKIMVTPVPLKLQTFLEKKLLIRNFDQTVEWYNEWVDHNQIGKPYTCQQINQKIQSEIAGWHAVSKLTE